MRRLQLLLLFFAYAFAQVEISFEQYLNLASEKNWPKNEEIFNAFRDYCNNASASQTTEFEGNVFTRVDCLTFAAQTTELTTLSTTMKMIRKSVNVKKGISYFGVIETDGCLKTTPFTTTTTPPQTTELTTIPTTTEVTAEKISIIEGNVRYNFEEPDCDNCISQISSSTSSSLSTTLSTESSSIQTSTPEESTTSLEILSSESSSTSENTQTSTSKTTESQSVASFSTSPSTVTPTTESLKESTENLETSTTTKTITSTKPTTTFTGIPSTTTETQTDMPSSSQKPTTTLKSTTKTKTATSPPQQAATQTETSAKISPTSVKSTKVKTTTKSGTSTMPSTKLQTASTTRNSSTVPSTSTALKTTIKPTTPKNPETTVPENVPTTVQSKPTSTSTEKRILDTTKTSVTSITESSIAQTDTSTSTMPEADTTTSKVSVTTTSRSHEKSPTTVTQDASTVLVEDTSSIASTKNEYSTTTITIAEKTNTPTSNTVTEITTHMPTTTSKKETSTVSDHLLTDTSTVSAASVTPSKNYSSTTPDVTVVSTTEQALPSTTKSNDAESLGTTLQNDEVLTTSIAIKMSSTTTPEATIPRIDEISPTKTQTLLETSTSTDNLNTEISASTTTVPESSTPTDTSTTLISTATPVTTVGENGVESSSSLSPTSSSTTTKMPTTSVPEIKAPENVESTTGSKSTKYSDSTPTSTFTESKPSSITTTVPVLTENQNDVTSTLPKTTSTLEGSTSSTIASSPTVTPTTIEENSSPAIVDQTSKESIKSTTTKISSTTEENQATSSSKMTSDKVTVTPEASTSSTTSASENRQSTNTSSEEPIGPTTKPDLSSTKTTPTTTYTSKSTKKATESATQSTVQQTESITFAPTAPSNPSTTPSKRTTTKRPTSTTTKSPICNVTCPPGFSEGDNACFKFILPNATDGAYYDDFLNACISMKGVIASLADFGNIKNVDTFQAMTNARNPKPAMVYTNAVPTKYHRTTQIVPVLELDEYSLTKMPVIGLSATVKYPNATVICRVGKYCQEYTCPVLEYFIPPTAKYLVATVPPNTVLKENEKLSVECFGTPQRSFEVKCDERGFLLPDSSMVKCETRNEIKSEPDGPVKSCDECDKFQTSSCEPLPSGEYYCNCKELYNGRTCTYPFNACENVTCQNGGTCENRFTYGFCNCETEYFGSVCQYEFYNSYEAWLMRAMAYTVTAVVAAETAVRTKKRMTPSAPGQFASLPTEMCKFYSAIFGSLALACRIMFEFPDSDDLAGAVQCGTTFVITMTLAFCSLTAMVAESIIALGVVINATANCYDGHYQERKKCVNNKRLITFYAIFCMIPFIIFCIFSSDMVTSRSCIGVLPWQGFPDSQQYAGLGLMVLMSAYALTACGLALAARQVLDHNIFETRRRYEADLADPTAYGREVLPVELNVRYYLLALKPFFFTLVWFSAIAAAERMEWWATYLATICSGIYGIISFVQNKLTVYDKVLERGVRMLDIKPSIKIPVAKVKNPATDRRVAFFRDDPLMNFDQQQQKFDLLESLCKSFTAEDMSKDEAETAAYVHKYFYYCNKRRSLLTKRVNDNRRRTVHDFLLDERRPNFIGPRTFERQLPPGITYLDHTAYYWECLNYETWKRLRIRAKYVELNIELRYEYNHFGDFLPWNWSRYSWDPNMVFDYTKYSPLDLPNIAEADENEEEDEDEDMEDAN